MVGKQLIKIFTKCCHRVEKVHAVAINCANRIIAAIPSALCQKGSLYAMLELLTLMWCSCLDEEIDEYSWRSTMTSLSGRVTIELSDSYPSRRKNLKAFHTHSREWVLHVLNIAPMDIKGLLQVIISHHRDPELQLTTYRPIYLNMTTMVLLGRSLWADHLPWKWDQKCPQVISG